MSKFEGGDVVRALEERAKSRNRFADYDLVWSLETGIDVSFSLTYLPPHLTVRSILCCQFVFCTLELGSCQTLLGFNDDPK